MLQMEFFLIMNHLGAVKFVTRKITKAVARIAKGSQEKLYLGNLTAIRDWGYAKEYVESMWLMLQQDLPGDYVVATGVGATIQDFCHESFSRVNLNWEDFVVQDSRYLRPTEVDALIGDPTKAREVLGWEAKTHWTTFGISRCRPQRVI